MARSATSSFILANLPFLVLALFATSAVATSASAGTILVGTAGTIGVTTFASATANGTYTKPAPTNTGSVAATSSIVGAAAMPDAQFSAFFALTLAIAGSFALGLGL